MTTYRVEFTDARGALAAAGAHLAAEPVLHTIVTSMAHKLVDAPPAEHPRWFAVVREDERIAGVAMRTASFAPHPVYVLPLPEGAARALGEALRARGEVVTELNGFLPALAHVAEGLDLTGELRERLRLFELATLRAPPAPPGALRIATEDDVPLVREWFGAFGAAAAEQAGQPHLHHAGVRAEDVAQEIAQGRIALWVDGEPVHVSAARPPSFGVSRIGPVYTPKAHRGRGYAAATVHALARGLLAEGARVCLFADQKNPVSTRLYESLGFRGVAETALLSLR